MSPAARSLAWLRAAGYRAEVVERWIPRARVRRDLFGVIDIVAVRPGETLGVQSTSATNVAARVKKLRASPARPDLADAGWRLVVHGWAKRGGRWALREVPIDR